MRDQRSDFQKRLERLGNDSSRSYARSQRGARTGMYDFVEEERRKKRRFPIRGFLTAVLLCLGLLWVLKAYLIAEMGTAAYEQRLTELQQSEDSLARFGAVLVEKDPLTIFLIETLFPAAAERGRENDPVTLTVPEEDQQEVSEE